MSATRLLLPLAIAGSTVAAGGALPAAAHPAAQGEIAVTAGKPSEFRFMLSKTKVEKGTKVTFVVTNLGTLRHDFRIAGKQTPLLKVGKTGKLDVTFEKAGRYHYRCTMSGHAAAGMTGVVVVT